MRNLTTRKLILLASAKHRENDPEVQLKGDKVAIKEMVTNQDQLRLRDQCCRKKLVIKSSLKWNLTQKTINNQIVSLRNKMKYSNCRR